MKWKVVPGILNLTDIDRLADFSSSLAMMLWPSDD